MQIDYVKIIPKFLNAKSVFLVFPRSSFSRIEEKRTLKKKLGILKYKSRVNVQNSLIPSSIFICNNFLFPRAFFGVKKSVKEKNQNEKNKTKPKNFGFSLYKNKRLTLSPIAQKTIEYNVMQYLILLAFASRFLRYPFFLFLSFTEKKMQRELSEEKNGIWKKALEKIETKYLHVKPPINKMSTLLFIGNNKKSFFSSSSSTFRYKTPLAERTKGFEGKWVGYGTRKKGERGIYMVFGVRNREPLSKNISFHEKRAKERQFSTITKPETEKKFFSRNFDKNRLKKFVIWFNKKWGLAKTLQLLETLKFLGFKYAQLSGLSLNLEDLYIPDEKEFLVNTNNFSLIEQEFKVFQKLNDQTNYSVKFISTWSVINQLLRNAFLQYFKTGINPLNNSLKTPLKGITKNNRHQQETKNYTGSDSLYIMAFSGARGNMSQVSQLTLMRGLMSDPLGNLVEFPIISNFKEGLNLTEYLISCYGARKGIIDTGLRTATAGDFTRRLVDVAHSVIIRNYDCFTKNGIYLNDLVLFQNRKTLLSLEQRLIGRIISNNSQVSQNYRNKEIPSSSFFNNMVNRSNSYNKDSAGELNSKIQQEILVRSPLTCEVRFISSLCRKCYGWNAMGKIVDLGDAVGVIAAQSLGEPGTQLTLRTFHTGGIYTESVAELQLLVPFDGHLVIPNYCSIKKYFNLKEKISTFVAWNKKSINHLLPSFSPFVLNRFPTGKLSRNFLPDAKTALLAKSKEVVFQPTNLSDKSNQNFFEKFPITINYNIYKKWLPASKEKNKNIRSSAASLETYDFLLYRPTFEIIPIDNGGGHTGKFSLGKMTTNQIFDTSKLIENNYKKKHEIQYLRRSIIESLFNNVFPQKFLIKFVQDFLSTSDSNIFSPFLKTYFSDNRENFGSLFSDKPELRNSSLHGFTFYKKSGNSETISTTINDEKKISFDNFLVSYEKKTTSLSLPWLIENSSLPSEPRVLLNEEKTDRKNNFKINKLSARRLPGLNKNPYSPLDMHNFISFNQISPPLIHQFQLSDVELESLNLLQNEKPNEKPKILSESWEIALTSQLKSNSMFHHLAFNWNKNKEEIFKFDPIQNNNISLTFLESTLIFSHYFTSYFYNISSQLYITNLKILNPFAGSHSLKTLKNFQEMVKFKKYDQNNISNSISFYPFCTIEEKTNIKKSFLDKNTINTKKHDFWQAANNKNNIVFQEIEKLSYYQNFLTSHNLLQAINKENRENKINEYLNRPLKPKKKGKPIGAFLFPNVSKQNSPNFKNWFSLQMRQPTSKSLQVNSNNPFFNSSKDLDQEQKKNLNNNSPFEIFSAPLKKKENNKTEKQKKEGLKSKKKFSFADLEKFAYPNHQTTQIILLIKAEGNLKKNTTVVDLQKKPKELLKKKKNYFFFTIPLKKGIFNQEIPSYLPTTIFISSFLNYKLMTLSLPITSFHLANSFLHLRLFPEREKRPVNEKKNMAVFNQNLKFLSDVFLLMDPIKKFNKTIANFRQEKQEKFKINSIAYPHYGIQIIFMKRSILKTRSKQALKKPSSIVNFIGFSFPDFSPFFLFPFVQDNYPLVQDKSLKKKVSVFWLHNDTRKLNKNVKPPFTIGKRQIFNHFTLMISLFKEFSITKQALFFSFLYFFFQKPWKKPKTKKDFMLKIKPSLGSLKKETEYAPVIPLENTWEELDEDLLTKPVFEMNEEELFKLCRENLPRNFTKRPEFQKAIRSITISESPDEKINARPPSFVPRITYFPYKKQPNPARDAVRRRVILFPYFYMCRSSSNNLFSFSLKKIDWKVEQKKEEAIRTDRLYFHAMKKRRSQAFLENETFFYSFMEKKIKKDIEQSKDKKEHFVNFSFKNMHVIGDKRQNKILWYSLVSAGSKQFYYTFFPFFKNNSQQILTKKEKNNKQNQEKRRLKKNMVSKTPSFSGKAVYKKNKKDQERKKNLKRQGSQKLSIFSIFSIWNQFTVNKKIKPSFYYSIIDPVLSINLDELTCRYFYWMQFNMNHIFQKSIESQKLNFARLTNEKKNIFDFGFYFSLSSLNLKPNFHSMTKNQQIYDFLSNMTLDLSKQFFSRLPDWEEKQKENLKSKKGKKFKKEPQKRFTFDKKDPNASNIFYNLKDHQKDPNTKTKQTLDTQNKQNRHPFLTHSFNKISLAKQTLAYQKKKPHVLGKLEGNLKREQIKFELPNHMLEVYDNFISRINFSHITNRQGLLIPFHSITKNCFISCNHQNNSTIKRKSTDQFKFLSHKKQFSFSRKFLSKLPIFFSYRFSSSRFFFNSPFLFHAQRAWKRKTTTQASEEKGRNAKATKEISFSSDFLQDLKTRLKMEKNYKFFIWRQILFFFCSQEGNQKLKNKIFDNLFLQKQDKLHLGVKLFLMIEKKFKTTQKLSKTENKYEQRNKGKKEIFSHTFFQIHEQKKFFNNHFSNLFFLSYEKSMKKIVLKKDWRTYSLSSMMSNFKKNQKISTVHRSSIWRSFWRGGQKKIFQKGIFNQPKKTTNWLYFNYSTNGWFIKKKKLNSTEIFSIIPSMIHDKHMLKKFSKILTHNYQQTGFIINSSTFFGKYFKTTDFLSCLSKTSNTKWLKTETFFSKAGLAFHLFSQKYDYNHDKDKYGRINLNKKKNNLNYNSHFGISFDRTYSLLLLYLQEIKHSTLKPTQWFPFVYNNFSSFRVVRFNRPVFLSESFSETKKDTDKNKAFNIENLYKATNEVRRKLHANKKKNMASLLSSSSLSESSLSISQRFKKSWKKNLAFASRPFQFPEERSHNSLKSWTIFKHDAEKKIQSAVFQNANYQNISNNEQKFKKLNEIQFTSNFSLSELSSEPIFYKIPENFCFFYFGFPSYTVNSFYNPKESHFLSTVTTNTRISAYTNKTKRREVSLIKEYQQIVECRYFWHVIPLKFDIITSKNFNSLRNAKYNDSIGSYSSHKKPLKSELGNKRNHNENKLSIPHFQIDTFQFNSFQLNVLNEMYFMHIIQSSKSNNLSSDITQGVPLLRRYFDVPKNSILHLLLKQTFLTYYFTVFSHFKNKMVPMQASSFSSSDSQKYNFDSTMKPIKPNFISFLSAPHQAGLDLNPHWQTSLVESKNELNQKRPAGVVRGMENPKGSSKNREQNKKSFNRLSTDILLMDCSTTRKEKFYSNLVYNSKYKMQMNFKLRRMVLNSSLVKILQKIVNNVQAVYCGQGVEIYEQHIEIMVKQMGSKVRVKESPVYSKFFWNEIIPSNLIQDTTTGEFEPTLSGITKISLQTDSFLSAASFQSSVKILTQASLKGSTDFLLGLKENVIVNELIPSGTGLFFKSKKKKISPFYYRNVLQSESTDNFNFESAIDDSDNLAPLTTRSRIVFEHAKTKILENNKK